MTPRTHASLAKNVVGLKLLVRANFSSTSFLPGVPRTFITIGCHCLYFSGSASAPSTAFSSALWTALPWMVASVGGSLTCLATRVR